MVVSDSQYGNGRNNMDCLSKSGHIEGIRRALETFVGKPAQILWDDGTREVLTIVSVDDEGVVHKLIPPDEIQYYWNRHEEVTSVGKVPNHNDGSVGAGSVK